MDCRQLSTKVRSQSSPQYPWMKKPRPPYPCLPLYRYRSTVLLDWHRRAAYCQGEHRGRAIRMTAGDAGWRWHTQRASALDEMAREIRKILMRRGVWTFKLALESLGLYHDGRQSVG